MKNIHWQLCNHIKFLVARDLNPRPFSHCLLNHSIHSLTLLIGSVQLNVAMLRGYNFSGNGWNVFCFVFLLSDSQCKLIVVWLFFFGFKVWWNGTIITITFPFLIIKILGWLPSQWLFRDISLLSIDDTILFCGDRDRTFTSYSTCFGLLCFNADSGLWVNLRKIELVAIREVEVVSDLENLFWCKVRMWRIILKLGNFFFLSSYIDKQSV